MSLPRSLQLYTMALLALSLATTAGCNGCGAGTDGVDAVGPAPVEGELGEDEAIGEEEFVTEEGVGGEPLTEEVAVADDVTISPEITSDFALAYPTGVVETSVLLIQAEGPAQARVGQPYTYQIQVTNLRKDLVLEDVMLTHTLPTGAELVSFEAPGATPTQNQAQANQQNAGQGQEGWLINQLGPGESKTITLTAVGQEPGSATTCLGVTYNPVLCLATEFTQPELELVAVVPEVVDICEPIAVKYVVRNVGTAVAPGLVIQEELPEGLTTAEGERVLAIDVGDLEAGQEREFEAELVAAASGDYTLRPAALVADQVAVQARQVVVGVRQVDLVATIDGPQAEYVGEPMTYEVTVTNRGDAAALNTELTLEVAEPLSVLRADPVYDPEVGTVWDLGTIEPGQSRQVIVTAIARDPGAVKIAAAAASECAFEVEGATAAAAIATDVLTLPALLLAVVDQVDPVRVGANTVYSIKVVNQGSGPAENVRVAVELPPQLEFVEATGVTEAVAEAQAVNLGVIDQIAPGDSAAWRIVARAVEPGDVRTRVELNSEYLSSPVPDVEPTRVIPAE